MPTTDGRLTSWSRQAPAGVTQAWRFTSSAALTSLSVYTGGTVTDQDDLTGATEHAGVLSGGSFVATVPVAVPTGSSVPMRLVIDGTVKTVGKLIPSTNGSQNPSNEVAITLEDITVDLTVLGELVAAGNIDGGSAATTYGGTAEIDGGSA